MTLPAVGILVGGQGRRMGGVAKGWLRHEGRPLIERLLDAVRVAAAPAPLPGLFLIGNATAYLQTQVPSLADEPSGVGPMGGLRALLIEASRIGCDAVAIAVDMPFVNAGLIGRLYREDAGAAALAPRQEGRWQPLFARYRPAAVLPILDAALAGGQSSLQVLFAGLAAAGERAVELTLSAPERRDLRDWDRPSDMDGSFPDGER